MPDTITKTKTAEVLFLSRGPATRLIRKPSQSIYSSVGTYTGEVPGSRLFYEFEDHQLRVRPGQDRLPDGPPDENGQPTEQDALTWLRSHPAFNGEEANSFHEHGNEPERVPDPSATLQAITQAVLGPDPVTDLEAILSDEREGHAREIVIAQCEAALESVHAALESIRQAEAGTAPENG